MKFFVLVFIFALSSCGLRYEPPVTPESSQQDRRYLIERTIEQEFASLHKTYQPIGYGETVKIKPVSYLKLDSLFAQKYELERTGRRDVNLDEAIKKQQIICKNDTNEVLYLERHVFTLEGEDGADILSGDFYITKNNELKDVQFTETYKINKDYINYYKLYAFEQPFLGGNYPSNEEQDFYALYKEELHNRTKKDEFLENTLRLMQIAYYKRSLETQTLLKELTRKFVHNDRSNYSDEVFIKIERLTGEDNLISYLVVYQSVVKTSEGIYTKKHQLTFDSFLVLESMDEIPF